MMNNILGRIGFIYYGNFYCYILLSNLGRGYSCLYIERSAFGPSYINFTIISAAIYLLVVYSMALRISSSKKPNYFSSSINFSFPTVSTVFYFSIIKIFINQILYLLIDLKFITQYKEI